MLLSAALCAAAAAAAHGNRTSVYTLNDVPVGVAAAAQRVRCAACGTGDGLVDTWRPAVVIDEKWAPPNATMTVDIRGGHELADYLRAAGVAHDVVIPDVAAAIDAERARRLSAPRAGDDFFADYRTYEEIMTKLTEWVSDYGVQEFTVGESVEGRAIRGVRFGASPHNDAVYFQCGIHAREWISPATCMYFADKLLRGQKSGDAAATALLSRAIIYLVPIANPDGYAYTFGGDRLWRKNRRRNSDGSYGVDLNRNWEPHWGVCGASTNPNSDTYMGPSSFSEPESSAVRNFFQRLSGDGVRMQSGIDFHSYGQLLLRPYGWNLPNRGCYDGSGDGRTCTPLNEAENLRAMTVYHNALQGSGHAQGRWTSEHAAELYCAAGGADDWIATGTRQASGFCVELRPEGNPGFTLPASGIVPSGEENYAAVLAWVGHIMDTAEVRRRG